MFAVGYPLREGRAGKSDDLLFEKILYSGALAKRMRGRERKVKVVKYDGEIGGDYDVLMLLLPKGASGQFEIRGDGVYIGEVKIDFVSDNLTRIRNDLVNYAESINFNGMISDSKHLTYKAVDNYLKSTRRKSPVKPLYSHRVNVSEIGDEKIRKEISEAAREILARGRRILVKPDKGSGGGGIRICESEAELREKVEYAGLYAPDGNVLVMECAPIVPVDLDASVVYGGRWRSGDLLEGVIRKTHRHALEVEIPETFLRGRHAVDVRIYVVCVRGREVAEKYRLEGVDEDKFYLAPMAAIFRMAPGIWVDDPKVLAKDPSIVKCNISQEVGDKGAWVKHGELRLFLPSEETLAALGYRERYKGFMIASFDAVKATIQYHEKLDVQSRAGSPGRIRTGVCG